jgi:monoamine oxidase
MPEVHDSGRRPPALLAVLPSRRLAVSPSLACYSDDIENISRSAALWNRGGASIAVGPGTWTEHGAALRAPVDRIHWAGTETAIEQWGSMDGAVSAAVRAVREVVG